MTAILHVLDHSLPDQDGYATRSHSILRALTEFGIPLQVLTGPRQEQQQRADEHIDGIDYKRSPINADQLAGGVKGQLQTILSIRRSIKTLTKHQDIGLLHVHSPCLNGLAAMGMGLPFIYEMRSSWEDAAVSSGTTTEGSLRYRLSRMLETRVARSAQSIAVICQGLKTELISRGIDAEKIHVVPNALSESLFANTHHGKGVAVREQHQLADAKVIGFFGSFFEWEGVDNLVRAMPGILENVPNARLLIAGGGRQEKLLHAIVKSAGLQGKVIFAGRVNGKDIPSYYDAADVMVFPRRSDRLTEMVTPLKPLESMALDTLVVASDVGGHKELIVDGETGFLYRADDEGALIKSVVRALDGSVDVVKIISQGKQFVTQERRWANVSKNYLPIYQQLMPSLKKPVEIMS